MRRPIIVAALLCACPPASQTTTDGSPTTSTGTTPTTGTTSSTETEPTTGTSPTTSAPTPDLPPPCPVGSLECPCTGGGACDPGLVCEDGTCVQGCAVGSPGCPCTPGGGCDPGSTCVDGTCGEALSPPCSTEQVMDDCCGDGWLDEFEECDKGKFENDDEGECTTKCKTAVCGDGVVHEAHEACDGGDDCTSDCTLKSCGNGTVDPGEWCEPRGDDDPECTALCGDGRKIIFVSSKHYKGGEIGGITGGDAKCQALADVAGLAGEFKVWLATSKDDAPLLRFSWFPGPYVDVNGNLMAYTWAEIYQSANPAPVITEQGIAAADSEIEWIWKEPVITRLIAWASELGGPGGPAVDPAHCGGWSDVAENGGVALLDPNPEIEMSGSFKVIWGGPPCDLAAPIICVEQ